MELQHGRRARGIGAFEIDLASRAIPILAPVRGEPGAWLATALLRSRPIGARRGASGGRGTGPPGLAGYSSGGGSLLGSWGARDVFIGRSRQSPGGFCIVGAAPALAVGRLLGGVPARWKWSGLGVGRWRWIAGRRRLVDAAVTLARGQAAREQQDQERTDEVLHVGLRPPGFGHVRASTSINARRGTVLHCTVQHLTAAPCQGLLRPSPPAPV